jgi:hypothetical protein
MFGGAFSQTFICLGGLLKYQIIDKGRNDLDLRARKSIVKGDD